MPISPGGKHFSITRSGANYVAVVDDAPPVNRHKPSVEVLFKSVAASAGRNAYGIMLTGMGADGATPCARCGVPAATTWCRTRHLHRLRHAPQKPLPVG
jgi:chemotaxis response regulator CheB